MTEKKLQRHFFPTDALKREKMDNVDSIHFHDMKMLVSMDTDLEEVSTEILYWLMYGGKKPSKNRNTSIQTELLTCTNQIENH